MEQSTYHKAHNTLKPKQSIWKANKLAQRNISKKSMNLGAKDNQRHTREEHDTHFTKTTEMMCLMGFGMDQRDPYIGFTHFIWVS